MGLLTHNRLIETLAAAVSCGLLTGACGSSGSNPVEPSPSGGTSRTPTAACQISATSTSGPVLQLFSHTITVGSTTDGLSLTGLTEVLPKASVPDGVVLPDGSVGIYYVDATTHAVWLGRWTGGALVPVSAITIDGVPAPEGVVDPDATNLGGQVRLAYLAGFADPWAVRAMCLADSDDGINFQSVSVAWRLGVGATQTDPSLIRLPSGTWLMAISDGHTTRIGQSSGGLSFSEISTMTEGGVPELSLTPEGNPRLHVCQLNGIGSHVSADGGFTWAEERIVVSLNRFPGRMVCDPSYVPAAGLFIFKVG